MNGRVYDPRIGRFVSPDPIVQAPWFSQSYNRYAYVFGSPLSYTDPSGYEPKVTFEGGKGKDINLNGFWVEMFDWGMAFPDVPVAGGIGVVTFPVVPIDIPQDMSPTPGDPTPPASQFDVGQWAWSTWGQYGGYVVQGVGVGLIVVDILNTPISPTPDLGIIGAAMIARGAAARGAGKIPWGTWGDYAKVVRGDETYAQVGDRLYTRHAVERMMPRGLTTEGRSVSPNFVEDAIRTGTATSYEVDGVLRTMHTSGTLRVVTERGGSVVVTIIH
jgi:hypothetical protein